MTVNPVPDQNNEDMADGSKENPWKFQQVHGSSKPPSAHDQGSTTHMGHGQM